MTACAKALRSFAMMYPILGASTLAGSLADIEHVILFMQGCTKSFTPYTSTK
jgi:hypothetical protein